jgi:glyoxylase-like metal-dependent hydrolase (beta-lactamase superfamily II)
MKGRVLIALLVASSLSAAAAAQQQPPAPGPGRPAGAGPARPGLPPPEPIEHITGNIYKIFGGGGNTLVVVQHDGVVLVDTKMPGNGQAILDQVRSVTDKPIKVIISTHSHPDHTGSTDFLRQQYPDVRIIMSEGTKAELSANPQANPALLPTETYKDRLTIGEGDERIELYHTGTGHTNGDTFVLIPSARLLFMGDVMAWNMAPFLPAGGAMAIADGAKRHYAAGDPPGAVVADLKKNPDFAPLLDTHIKKGLEYGNTPLARAHMNVNVAYEEFAGEPVGFGVANGQPLPANDKHKGSNPADTGPPTPAMLADEVTY